MWGRVLATEWQKLRPTGVWVPVLAAPAMTVLIGAVERGIYASGQTSHLPWLTVYAAVVHLYAVLFLPLLAGILASLCCRIEHLAGGWKQLFALPVTRTAIYAAKFVYVLLFLALAQALVLLGVWMDGVIVLHLSAPFPWTLLTKGVIGGWVATVPLAALQLWVATWWKSFAEPFALNVVCTIPATAIIGSSTFAPIYPWSHPMLAMLPGAHGTFSLTTETATTLLVAGMVFIVGGWLHFATRDLYA